MTGNRFTRYLSGTLAAGLLVAALSGCNTDTTGSSSGGGSGGSSGGGSQPKKGPSYTTAQENAIRSAKQYLSMSTGFSRAGLIQQLSSKAGDGFKKADAVFAVNHIKVDYNKQAVLSAKAYLSMSGFSKSGLIEQLTSKAGDQYTQAQAMYAAKKVGL